MSRLKEAGTAPSDYQPYDVDYDDGEECGNCGGEGYTYLCIDGCCVDAEEGCEICARRCDWCNPPRKRAPEELATRSQHGGGGL